jgi:hypothetical protein
MISATPVKYKGKPKTGSSISITKPGDAQQSTPPFAGHYQVKCKDQNDKEWTSQAIQVGASARWVEFALQKIPFLVDNIEVTDDYDGLFTFP